MKIKYDRRVDVLYIEFEDTTVTTKRLDEDVAIDYDTDGHIAGVEILSASKRVFGKAKEISLDMEDAIAEQAIPLQEMVQTVILKCDMKNDGIATLHCVPLAMTGLFSCLLGSVIAKDPAGAGDCGNLIGQTDTNHDVTAMQKK